MVKQNFLKKKCLKILGPTNFWTQKILGQKIFWVIRILVQQFGSKELFWSHKNLTQVKFWHLKKRSKKLGKLGSVTEEILLIGTHVTRKMLPGQMTDKWPWLLTFVKDGVVPSDFHAKPNFCYVRLSWIVELGFWQ